MNDIFYMRRCLELARQAGFATRPNPNVGCVIVRAGCVIGSGYHICCGGPHAEVNAIQSVTDKTLLTQSTLYVNLEPCSHWGKTPPCCDLILRMGIPRVVVGTLDPFVAVQGRGVQRLRDGGVEVTVGVLEGESRALNADFMTYHTFKRPYVILKWAETVDGYLDNNRPREISPTWMTGPACRTLVHRWRSEVDAILCGTNTIERDNPTLTVREVRGKNPLRVVLDRTLRLAPDRAVFNADAPTLLVTALENVTHACQLHPGVEVVGMEWGHPAQELMNLLYQRSVMRLLVEGGRALFDTFLEAGLWDEMRVFQSSLGVSDLAGGSLQEPRGVKAPLVQGRISCDQKIADVRLIITQQEPV